MATEAERTFGPRQAATSRPVARERLNGWGVMALFAPFALALAAYLAVFLVLRPDVTGDEPHYLLVAESIAYDGDVELTNDYASRDRTLRILPFFPLGPHLHAADYKGSGELRPLHGVGLSALLAPAVALGGVTGARLVMVLIAALLADQLYRLLRALGFRRRYRALAWAAVVFCLPLLVFSSQIYPELPAALASWSWRYESWWSGWHRPLHLRWDRRPRSAPLAPRPLSPSLARRLFLGLAYAALVTREERAEASAASGVGGLPDESASRFADLQRPRSSRWQTVTLPLVVPYGIGVGSSGLAFQRWYGSLHPKRPTPCSTTTHSDRRAGGFGTSTPSPTYSTPSSGGSHSSRSTGSALPRSAA